MATSVTASELAVLPGNNAPPPLIIDVRRANDFLSAKELVSGALRRDPDHIDRWSWEIPAAADVVVYCSHGAAVSESVAEALTKHGRHCAYLAGGMNAWRQAGGAVDRKPAGSSTRWITRSRPKIDRIACPWLISRFIDPDAAFLYVPSAEVRTQAAVHDATPYDIPDTKFGHVGEECSFDAFIHHYRLGGDPALAHLATIVRGADTDRLSLTPQSPGLLAVSLGLSRNFEDDHEMLGHGMVMYDALFRWCREGREQTHSWAPTRAG